MNDAPLPARTSGRRSIGGQIMNTRERWIACCLTLSAAVIPASAQSTVGGVFPTRTTSAGIVDVLGENWNVNEYDCFRTRAKNHFTGPFSTPLPMGRSIIALPRVVNSPPIEGAEDLFAALGGAAVVNSVGKFDTATGSVLTWDGAVCSSTPELGCGDACFCIDTPSGQGFVVDLAAATTFQVEGFDGPLEIDLTAPGDGTPPSSAGQHDISLPMRTPLNTASDLRDDIDNQGGTGVSVSHWVAATDSLITYAGASTESDFALTPGFGYRVQVASSLVYNPPFDGSTLYIRASSGPCVGRELALTFDVPGDETVDPIAFSLVVDCTPQGTLTAAMSIDGGPLLDMTSGVVDFGPFTSSGSEYPIAGPVGIPSLGEWGMIICAIVLLAAGMFLIVTRFS